jgi:hypothetical protein
MEQYAHQSEGVVYGSAGVMRDAAPVNVSYAAEQIYKELSMAHDQLEKLLGRLTPIMVPATPRDPSDVKLKSVSDSSPLVGDLMDMRDNVHRLVGVLIDIDNRLTL